MTSTQEHEAENLEIPILPVSPERNADGLVILVIMTQPMEMIIQKFDVVIPLWSPSPPPLLHDREA